MNHSHARLFLAAVAWSFAVFSTNAKAQVRLTDKDVVSQQLRQSTGKLFPLSEVGACEQGRFQTNDNATVSFKGSVLEIRGTDFNGMPWSAKVRVNGPGCSVLQGDLDDNGRPDLVIYAPGITDTGAYGTAVSLILFDKNGKPFPWQATGRFTLIDGGIQEIRQDSKGTLIVQTSELGLPAWGESPWIPISIE